MFQPGRKYINLASRLFSRFQNRSIVYCFFLTDPKWNRIDLNYDLDSNIHHIQRKVLPGAFHKIVTVN